MKKMTKQDRENARDLLKPLLDGLTQASNQLHRRNREIGIEMLLSKIPAARKMTIRGLDPFSTNTTGKTTRGVGVKLARDFNAIEMF